MNPEKLFYAPTHEWAAIQKTDQGTIATIGITDFAVKQLTDLVYMELPSVGTHVAAGEELGEVESVKAVSPIYSPVGGEVVAVNTALPNQLDTLAGDPYEAGWIVKIKMDNDSDRQSLLDHTAYQKQCAEHG